MAVDESVKIVISAEDKSSGVLNDIGKSAGNLGNAFKQMGTLALAGIGVAAGAISAFAVSSINEFIDAEKKAVIANTALQNAFDNLTSTQVANLKKELGTSTVSLSQIKDAMQAAGKSALQLGFDDDAARLAFAKLFQVTGDVTKAQNDMKLAMDLAAFSGRTLQESADAITKVHAGATRVLKEFGLQLDDNATSADALRMLQDVTASSAENMANTTAGKLAILHESWANLQEQVGSALATAISPFIDKLSAWAQDPATQVQFQGIATKIAGLITQLGPLVQMLLPAMIQGMNIATTVVKGLTIGFEYFQQGLTDGIYGILQIIEAIKQMIDWVNKAIASLNQLAAKVPGSGGLNFTNSIGDSISNALGIGKRAAGGPVSAGSAFLVGEQGPELFVPGQNGRILPNGTGVGGGTVINITGTFLSQDAAMLMAEKLMDVLKLQMRI